MNQMNQPMGGQPAMMQPQSRSSRAPWIVLILVIIVVLAVLGFLFRDKLGIAKGTGAKLSGYQAVFLTNGQVYFGKISGDSSQYVTLKDIYYLQVNQSQDLQSGANAQQQQQQQAQQNPQLSLVKLGNELHGPDDIMHINRDQILFFEDLKADGRVAQAIVEYQKNPNGTGAAPAAQTPASNGTGTTTPAAPAPTPTK